MSIKEEDKSYIHDLFQEYYHYIYAVVKNSILNSSEYEIEDCVQEVFIVALIKVDIIKEINYQKFWLAKTARNISMNYNEKKKRQNTILDDGEILNQIRSNENIEDIVLDKIEGDFIKHLSIPEVFDQELKEDEKKLYYMKFRLGLSNDDIGIILSISSKAVNTRAGRLKKKIKKIIHKKLNE